MTLVGTLLGIDVLVALVVVLRHWPGRRFRVPVQHEPV